MDEGSCSYSTGTTRKTITTKLSESLYELYRPRGEPSGQVIFFHGFQLRQGSEPHLSTWKSGDDSCIWPQTWLVDKFPNAHVLTVSYKADLLRDSKARKVDMHIIVENILSDLLQENVGQNPRCPVVLVGHSFGGLVLKQLCLHARKGDTPKHEKFLSAVKGFLFYSTPHRGIPIMGSISSFLSDSPLLEYVETLSTSAARMNSDFDKLVTKYGWLISGVGENLPTKLNPFPAFVVVPEGSSRYGDFNIMPNADHITVCKPMEKSSTSFNKLEKLLDNLSISNMQMVPPENFQHLPQEFQIVGMENILDTIGIKLHDTTSLGLAGMGGIGKSTLAKALFNALESRYEYTCFIKDVKNVTKSRDIRDAILLNLHHLGTRTGKEKENNLGFLKGKRLLLILDDVALEERDLGIVALLQNTIAIHKDSRFVATSRDGELLKRCLEDAHTMQLLSIDTSRKLLLSHAFPEGVPPYFGGDIDYIVGKCGQLPLALELAGKHLKYKDESIWREVGIAFSEQRTIHDFQDKLMSSLQLSYDGLDEEQKQMFLDAGTVFYQHTLKFAKLLWRMTTKESQDTCWVRLVSLSLVCEEEQEVKKEEWDVKEDYQVKCIGMHEQHRCLANQIASTPQRDGRRFWGCGQRAWEVFLGNGSSSVDVQDIVALDLNCEKLTGDIREGMMALQQESIGCFRFLDGLKTLAPKWCGGMERICIPRNMLCRMGSLRYMRLHGVDVDDELPSTMVWLDWSHARSTNLPFNPDSHKRMAVLILRSPYIRTLPPNFGKLSGLHILRISCKLKSLPDSFGELLSLEVLVFDGCEFVKLPETFGSLRNLKEVLFEHAVKLKALPQSFGELSQLNSLVLDDCPQLEALPSSFAQLQSLKQLTLRKVKSLLQSFEDLSQLESLELDGCELEALPESIGRLQNLKHLKLSGAENWKSLPQSFWALSQLESLELVNWPELETFPDSFGGLSRLRRLFIFSLLKLNRLPDTFGDLAALEELKIYSCEALSTLPDSCGRLTMLKKLSLRECNSLSALPDSLGSLPMLKDGQIKDCATLETLPENLRNFIR